MYIFLYKDMGVSENRGTPKWMVLMENPIKMDDLGGKPTILGNIMASNKPGQVGAPDLFTSRGGKEGYYSGLGGRHRGAMGHGD